MAKRMYTYEIGLGYEGCIFERHTVQAENSTVAYYMGVRMLNPSKGFNQISVKRIKKN